MAHDVMLDVEISMPHSQFLKFQELSTELDISIPETVQRCMTEKCDEYLQMFKNNVPNEEDTSGTTTGIKEGTKEQAVSNEVG